MIRTIWYWLGPDSPLGAGCSGLLTGFLLAGLILIFWG